MKLKIVPNFISDRINAAIDKVLDGRPIDPDERQSVFHLLLDYFDEHGTIPDFELKPKASTP